jgi:hypothetical protein
MIKASSTILTPKQNDRTWSGITLPLQRGAISLAQKMMGTIFWDATGGILVDFLPRKKTVNALGYVQMLEKL